MIRGVDLVHESAGEGPDVIWGHGLTRSMAADDETGLVDWSRIRATNRVTRYDARGHGDSGSSVDPSDYAWRSLALDQLELADALGVGSYVAGGASMGCATALHAAVISPNRVRGLILAIPPTAWEGRAAQIDVYSVTADLVEAGDHEELLAGAAASPTPDPFIGDPEWEARFPQLLASTDPVRLARVLRGAGTADLPTPIEISTIDVPTLILAWTGDPGHPVTTAARLQELIPDSSLVLATTGRGLASWTDRVERFLTQF